MALVVKDVTRAVTPDEELWIAARDLISTEGGDNPQLITLTETDPFAGRLLWHPGDPVRYRPLTGWQGTDKALYMVRDDTGSEGIAVVSFKVGHGDDPHPDPDDGDDDDTGDGSDPVPVPAHGLTVHEFGAAGDGLQDDSAALTTALQYAADKGVVVGLPAGRTYRVDTPVLAATTGDVTTRWGLTGGGRIRSYINDGSDVIRIEAGEGHNVRYLLLDGFQIHSGANDDGAGIRLWARGNWSANVLSNLVLAGTRYGVALEGLIFETSLFGISCMDHALDGMLFKNMATTSRPYNISSISIFGANIAQCGRHGVHCVGPDDNPWGAPQDTALYGGYIRQCKGVGVRFRLGGHITGTHMENNPYHVSSYGPLTVTGLRGETQDGAPAEYKTVYLARVTGEANHRAIFRDCRMLGAKLLDGDGRIPVIVDECPGTVDITEKLVRTEMGVTTVTP